MEKSENRDALQLACELTRSIYRLTRKKGFGVDCGLKRQIREAAVSSMHHIFEGYDSQSSEASIRFMRYAKWSCTEVQNELHVALDRQYLLPGEFEDLSEQASRTRTTILGFIDHLAGCDVECLNIEH